MKQTIPYFTVFTILAIFASIADAGSGNRQQIRQDVVFAHPSLESAWKTAVTRQRPLMVMFTTDGCHFCDKMLAQTYSHPVVKRLLSTSTESVLVQARDYPQLIERLGIRGYPTSLLVSPKGNVLDVIEGFTDAKSFTQRISPLLKESALAGKGMPTHATAAAQSVGR